MKGFDILKHLIQNDNNNNSNNKQWHLLLNLFLVLQSTVTHENKVAGYYDVSPKRTQATVLWPVSVCSSSCSSVPAYLGTTLCSLDWVVWGSCVGQDYCLLFLSKILYPDMTGMWCSSYLLERYLKTLSASEIGTMRVSVGVPATSPHYSTPVWG